MLRIVLVTAVFATIALASSGPVRADEGPWCALRNFGSDLSEDCQFRTFEECRVTVVAGLRGSGVSAIRTRAGPLPLNRESTERVKIAIGRRGCF